MNDDRGTAWHRREFLLLGASMLGVCGCQSAAPAGGGGPGRVVDAGAASQYAGEGVYSNFRDVGFILVRHGGRLTALSSYCTHRRCKLEAEPDHTFSCPCHGSEFTAEGKVKKGPAMRDLPVLVVTTDPRGHLMVSVPAA